MACGLCANSSAACFKAFVAFSSPWARMILARASRAASASAAMALCSCSGSRESFLQKAHNGMRLWLLSSHQSPSTYDDYLQGESGFFLYVLVCVDRKLLCRTHGTIYITQRRVLVSSFPHLFKKQATTTGELMITTYVFFNTPTHYNSL